MPRLCRTAVRLCCVYVCTLVVLRCNLQFSADASSGRPVESWSVGKLICHCRHGPSWSLAGLSVCSVRRDK